MHMQGMHALSRSPQPGLVTDVSLGSGWKLELPSSIVSRSFPIAYTALSLVLRRVTPRRKTSNSTKTFQTRVEKHFNP